MSGSGSNSFCGSWCVSCGGASGSFWSGSSGGCCVRSASFLSLVFSVNAVDLHTIAAQVEKAALLGSKVWNLNTIASTTSI